MTRRVNANYGTIRSVSRDRTTVKIAAPRGGIFECRNEGFEVGQEVCFILDALNRRIIKILPKNVADAQYLLGLNLDLQEILQDKPINNDVEIPENVELMEETDGDITVNSERCGHEEHLDLFRQTYGEEPEEWGSDDWPEFCP